MLGKVLKPEEDALGQELWAYYSGKDSYEIIERDDGYFDACFHVPYYFSGCDEWIPIERKAMEFAKGKVIDIGCGAGRHSLYLQEKGFDVLGIDISPLAVKVCTLRGVRRVEVMSIDDVNFGPNSFDTILMMGNNFGLLGSLAKARRLLKRFQKMTSKDALIVAETCDPYETKNPAHLEYHERNRKRGKMSGQLKIRVRFGRYVTPWFDYLIVSKEEMKKILERTGWKIEQFIDSDGPKYIAIVEKANKI